MPQTVQATALDLPALHLLCTTVESTTEEFRQRSPSARVALQPAITYSHSFMPDLFPSRLFAALSMAFK